MLQTVSARRQRASTSRFATTTAPTPLPTVSPYPTPVPIPAPTPRPTVAPTATRGSDTVDAAHRLSGVSAALLVLEGLRGEYHVCSEPASLAELTPPVVARTVDGNQGRLSVWAVGA